MKGVNLALWYLLCTIFFHKSRSIVLKAQRHQQA